jgi:thiamine transport system substrate-binding protein
MRRALLGAVLVGALLAAGCGGDGDGDEPVTITLVTHDSFAVSDDVLAAFEDRSGVDVRVLQGGDAGQVVNQAILTKDDPQGDVLFGVDTTFLSRALDAGIFEPHLANGIEAVPERYDVDPDHRVTPVDHGEVCLNYDVGWFEDHGIAPPDSLDDLPDPRYEDLLVVENPATSSPGLAFLLATVATYGDGGWLDWWSSVADNGLLVTEGWEEAFNGEFSAGGGGGDRPIVVSYASSPPVAVYFADPPPEESPIGVVEASCFEQVEYAGVLAGTDHADEAGQLVDFFLSPAFQEDVPLGMFVFPAVEGTPLPEVFTEFAAVPEDPLRLPVDVIGQGRDDWVDAWTATVLR